MRCVCHQMSYCVVMGGTLGAVIGVVIGAMYAIDKSNSGYRLQVFLRTVGGSTALFALFLACGSAVRCEAGHRRRLVDAHHLGIKLPPRGTVTTNGNRGNIPRSISRLSAMRQ